MRARFFLFFLIFLKKQKNSFEILFFFACFYCFEHAIFLCRFYLLVFLIVIFGVVLSASFNVSYISLCEIIAQRERVLESPVKTQEIVVAAKAAIANARTSADVEVLWYLSRRIKNLGEAKKERTWTLAALYSKNVLKRTPSGEQLVNLASQIEKQASSAIKQSIEIERIYKKKSQKMVRFAESCIVYQIPREKKQKMQITSHEDVKKIRRKTGLNAELAGRFVDMGLEEDEAFRLSSELREERLSSTDAVRLFRLGIQLEDVKMLLRDFRAQGILVDDVVKFASVGVQPQEVMEWVPEFKSVGLDLGIALELVRSGVQLNQVIPKVGQLIVKGHLSLDLKVNYRV